MISYEKVKMNKTELVELTLMVEYGGTGTHTIYQERRLPTGEVYTNMRNVTTSEWYIYANNLVEPDGNEIINAKIQNMMYGREIGNFILSNFPMTPDPNKPITMFVDDGYGGARRMQLPPAPLPAKDDYFEFEYAYYCGNRINIIDNDDMNIIPAAFDTHSNKWIDYKAAVTLFENEFMVLPSLPISVEDECGN